MKACACCGIRELIQEKPKDIGAYTSKEFQWSAHETREKEFLDKFAFEDGAQPAPFQHHFTYKSRYIEGLGSNLLKSFPFFKH